MANNSKGTLNLIMQHRLAVKSWGQDGSSVDTAKAAWKFQSSLGGNKISGADGESMYQVFLTKTGLRKTNIAAATHAMTEANLKHGEEI